MAGHVVSQHRDAQSDLMTMADAGTLTDEQIDELLSQAEARLQAKAGVLSDDVILLENSETASKARKP
jgi:hypothetical protein